MKQNIFNQICRSTTDQTFYIRQILEKKCDSNGIGHKLLIDFEKAYDLVRREELYKIFILKEMYIKKNTGKSLSGTYPTQNGLKK
jgi:hypothetical protein